jgi:hypothetical protein
MPKPRNNASGSCPVSFDSWTTTPVQATGSGSRPAVLRAPATSASGQSIRPDGYWLRIPAGPPAADPVRWAVETAPAAGPGAPGGGNEVGVVNTTGWLPVGASVWRWSNGDDTAAACFPSLAFPTPAARGEKVDVDLRPGWRWALVYVAAYAIPAAGNCTYPKLLNVGEFS